MAVPSWRVIGIDTLEIEGRREDILNALELWEVEYSDLKASQEGISIKLPRYQSRKVENFLRAKSFSCRITKRRGLPVFLLKLIKRPGLIVGMAFFLISMYFYGSFVFDIKIRGNERLSDKYIIDALENSGFGVGSYIPSFDFDELSNKVPIEYGDISWIFVNMMGNVAYVEVREFELQKSEEPPVSDGPTDLVANVEGQIYRFEVSSGIVKVDIGQTVTKGQILVSGIEKGLKAEYVGRSKGRVFAKVAKEILVEQSFEVEEEVVVLKKLEKKYVNFFGFEINLLKNSGNFDEGCDIIEESRKLTLPDGTELPVVIREIYSIKKERKSRTLSAEEAKTAAEMNFEKIFFSQLEGAQILSTEKIEYTDGNNYVISAKIYCIVEISKEIPSVREDNAKDNENA